MSIDQEREYYFLEQLVQAPDQTLSAFAGSKAKPKGLDLDAAAKKNVEGRLLERGFISVEGKGKNKRINPTEAGEKHLATRPPPPEPQLDPRLKAFILMNLLSAGEAHVTMKQIKAQLSPALAKSLEFSKDAIVPVLTGLVKEHAIEQSEGGGASADDRMRFRLNASGHKMAMELEQHPLATFKLSGRILNDLIRGSNGQRHSPPPQATQPAVSHTATSTYSPASQLTDEMLINEGKELMRSTPGQDLLPIYQLRRRIRQKYGEHAASHENFDGRLMRMFGQRLRLVAISDKGRATPDQLSDGIPGADELFFYMRELR